MSSWKSRYTIVLLLLAALLTACSDEDFRGSISVINGEISGGASIQEIYVAKDCTEGWGAAKATTLSVAPGAWSAPVIIDWEEQSYSIIHPGLDNVSSSIVVDVRACFDTGTCGDETSVRIHDGELESVIIRDEGKPDTLTIC